MMVGENRGNTNRSWGTNCHSRSKTHAFHAGWNTYREAQILQCFWEGEKNSKKPGKHLVGKIKLKPRSGTQKPSRGQSINKCEHSRPAIMNSFHLLKVLFLFLFIWKCRLQYFFLHPSFASKMGSRSSNFFLKKKKKIVTFFLSKSRMLSHWEGSE